MTPFGSILTTFPTNLLHSTHASNNLPDDIHLFPSFSDYTGDTIARYRWNICIAIDEDRDNIFRSGNGTSGEVSAGRREVRENNEVHRPITRYLSPLIGWDLLWALLRTVFRRYCAIRLKFSIFPRFSAKSVVTTAKRPKRSKRIDPLRFPGSPTFPLFPTTFHLASLRNRFSRCSRTLARRFGFCPIRRPPLV